MFQGYIAVFNFTPEGEALTAAKGFFKAAFKYYIQDKNDDFLEVLEKANGYTPYIVWTGGEFLVVSGSFLNDPLKGTRWQQVAWLSKEPVYY